MVRFTLVQKSESLIRNLSAHDISNVFFYPGRTMSTWCEFDRQCLSNLLRVFLNGR